MMKRRKEAKQGTKTTLRFKPKEMGHQKKQKPMFAAVLVFFFFFLA